MTDSTSDIPDPAEEPGGFLRAAGPEGIIGIGLMIGILVVMSLGVFFRYVLNDSLSWSEELSRYGLVYATFIGTALAVRRNSHIRVSVLEEFLPGTRGVLRVIQYVITLVFVVLMTYLAIRISGVLYNTKSAAMLLPMTYVYAAIVVGFGLAALRLLLQLVRRR